MHRPTFKTLTNAFGFSDAQKNIADIAGSWSEPSSGVERSWSPPGWKGTSVGMAL